MPAEPDAPGLSPEAEDHYLRILRGDAVAEPDADALADLLRLGLVRRDDDGEWRATPPRSALARLAAQHEVAAVRLRESAEVLAIAYAERDADAAGFVEVLRGGDQVVATFEAMQLQATTDIRALDRGSYLSPEPGLSPVQPPTLARGVGYRVVYDASVLQTKAGLDSVRASVAAGERARVFSGVPLKLVIADADRALIAVPTATGGDVVALLVHRSVLLTALVELFEAFWRMASPVDSGGPEHGQEPTVATRRLLALLSAGLTDESIARELGVSERTVHRRVSRLLDLLGAQTRFQLGVQAARRDWLV
ncbi:Homeodomain-like domain-containing protein [Herbihabitans rhizosphaerae]|uniref:Homeodomain-like domain-containing protein n=1 Tax=Herbihabitans rhizosphaerae TaxID=1872711 RepID=A0A4Q7KP16_9PSEU|nr:helix-turn-helix transcriptional regulator [Herbihabitans rhizosphaerae]RZS36982.1 Homeodomain-like domain-containing protein [Herbihabitans rhizosphaerae]